MTDKEARLPPCDCESPEWDFADLTKRSEIVHQGVTTPVKVKTFMGDEVTLNICRHHRKLYPGWRKPRKRSK